MVIGDCPNDLWNSTNWVSEYVIVNPFTHGKSWYNTDFDNTRITLDSAKLKDDTVIQPSTGMNCFWRILSTRYGPPSFPIQLNLNEFKIEHCNDCNCGSLDVYDYNPYSKTPLKLIEKVCGSNIPEQIKSNAQNLFVRFHTNKNSTYRKKLEFSYSLEYVSGM